MRQGHSKAGILTHEGVFFGICLGADFVAEHEQGIGDLKRAFGVEESRSAKGILNLKMTKFPETQLTLFSKGQSTYLLCSRNVEWAAKDDATREKFQAEFHRHPRELSIYVKPDQPQMAGAWSERDFGIHVKGKEAKAQLEELYNAIITGHAAFGFTSALPAFDNSGLCIFIIPKFPKVFNDSLIAQQQDKLKLQEAADKTGIIEYLEAKKKGRYKGYFACTPHWNRSKTAHQDGEIMWWLNPYDQQENGFGYFTTQELKDWADDKEGNLISKHGTRYAKKD